MGDGLDMMLIIRMHGIEKYGVVKIAIRHAIDL